MATLDATLVEDTGLFDTAGPAVGGAYSATLIEDTGIFGTAGPIIKRILTAHLIDAGEAIINEIRYRMRGVDTTLSRTVYWDSLEVDDDFSDYAGPGPVNNIVVHKVYSNNNQ